MGKRSNFKRRKNDQYMTWDERAVKPLIPHLPMGAVYAEPCCGDMSLAKNLGKYGLVCGYASDIEPSAQCPESSSVDAMTLSDDDISKCDYIITNPPWTREILHPMLDHFRKMKPTWLLFDADWAHTKQSKQYMPYCWKIVSVGRVRWIPNSAMDGKDNVCWYQFGDEERETIFIGR